MPTTCTQTHTILHPHTLGIFATLLSAEQPSANFPLLLSFLNYVLCSTYLLRPLLRAYWSRHAGASACAVDHKDAPGDGRGIDRGNSLPASYESTSSAPGSGSGSGLDSGSSPTSGYTRSPRPGLDTPPTPSSSSSSVSSASATSLSASRSVTVSYWWYLLAALCDLEANYLGEYIYTVVCVCVCVYIGPVCFSVSLFHTLSHPR